ncbi:MAG: 50S ribosome-binding GTPase [Bacteroidetes bacterium]|nr:50S ribosome-binding GTPase [Bacteroidota bacterium]
MEVLRFLTAGSVDSGKSTLIGRLLFDSKNIPDDQLQELSSLSGGQPNLALVTDGLRAERQQGITIDVAYRYFSSHKRKFIVADAPGHQEFTRNLFTGASNCALMVILIEVNRPFTEQTRRHCMVAALLEIPLVVAVNKMDSVDYSEQLFNELKEKFITTMASLRMREPEFIPVSAVKGDNVVERSANMSWYKGQTLLEFLEAFQVRENETASVLRLYVQNVLSVQKNEKAITGRIQRGAIKAGDLIISANTGEKYTVKNIFSLGEKSEQANSGDSVTLTFEEDNMCNRGELLCKPGEGPSPINEFIATICWFDDSMLEAGTQFLLQYGTNLVPAVVRSINSKTDIHSFQQIACSNVISMNDVAEVSITTEQPVTLEAYSALQQTGVGILIDTHSNRTVAGILRR